jgi:hypothetical protein
LNDRPNRSRMPPYLPSTWLPLSIRFVVCSENRPGAAASNGAAGRVWGRDNPTFASDHPFADQACSNTIGRLPRRCGAGCSPSWIGSRLAVTLVGLLLFVVYCVPVFEVARGSATVEEINATLKHALARAQTVVISFLTVCGLLLVMSSLRPNNGS